MIITFEGIDGSGKSTLIKELKKYYQSKGKTVKVIKEPYKQFRKLILNPKHSFSDLTRLYLFLANRVESVNKITISEPNTIFLLDRFSLSTYAYQHYGLGIPLDLVKALNEPIVQDLKIDRTIYLDCPVHIAKLRSGNEDVYEGLGSDFMNSVRYGYHQLIKDMGNVFIVDGSKDKEKVFEEVKQEIDSLLQ